ncbi:GWxTD domain-containing protein [candidate division KSB1 bacterium]
MVRLFLYTACSFIMLLFTALYQPLFGQYADTTDIKNQHAYFRTIRAAGQSTFVKDFEYPFLEILTEAEKADYNNLSQRSEKVEFINNYWEKSNPNPLLQVNYRLKEHLDRVRHAKKNYSINRPPYFDDRGKYYLKYGEPFRRYHDAGGSKVVKFFDSPGVYATISYFYSTAPPLREFSCRPNESWAYWYDDRQIVIHFVNEGTFKEVASLDRALHTSINKNVIWYWMDLMKDRAMLSTATAEAVLKIDTFESEINNLAFGVKPVSELGSQSNIHRMMAEQKIRVESKERMLRTMAPVAAYYEAEALNTLPFTADVSMFKGIDNQTRIEITYYTPIHELKNHRSDHELSHDIELKYTSGFSDSLKALQFTRTTNQTYPSIVFRDNNPEYLVERLEFSAEPQNSEFFLQVGDKYTGRIGFIQETLDIPDFSRDSLMISDIQFYSPKSTDIVFYTLPVYLKKSMEVHPYPSADIQEFIPLLCYFEIYNLSTAGLSDSYDVDLRIYKDREGENIAKRLFRWLTLSHDYSMSIRQTRRIIENNDRELIELDLSNLGEGTYTLEITVSDTNNSNLQTQTLSNIKLKYK